MATTEAFEFLKWIHETGGSVFLLEQGEQWAEWVDGEGYKPEEILEGFREIEDASNHDLTFLDFVLNREVHSDAFNSWVEATLARLVVTESGEIKEFSGGTIKQTGLSLQSKLQTRKERLNQELKELQEIKTHVQDPTYSTVYHNNGCTRTDYTYIGSKGSLGQLDVTTYSNGSIQVYGDFCGSDGRYYKNNFNLMIGDNIISRYGDLQSKVMLKNASLVDKADILYADIGHINYSLGSVWNTDLNPWTRQYILDSKTVDNIKAEHLQQYKHIQQDKKAKQILEKLYHVDLSRSLNNRQKLEVFALDWEVTQRVKASQKVDNAKREAKTKVMEVEAVRDNIITLENEALEYEQIYREAKEPVNDYITLFGRLRGNSDTTKSFHLVHYKNYSNEIQEAEKKASKGNVIYAHNYEKKRANLAAKREEMFGKSEARAVKASIATYQEAMQQGNPRKVSIGLAMATYLQTLVKEDLNFLRKKREEVGQIRDGWNSMSKRQRSQIKRSLYLVDPYRREGFTLAGQVARETLPLLDVSLSVGADILERQIRNTEKAYHDQQEHFSVMRLELLVTRLTLEYTMAEHYEVWYAKHPLQQYHVVKQWFVKVGKDMKGAFKDLWHTFTAPFRATKSMIKGWSSGQGFMGGLHDGWDVEKNALGDDIHGVNHMVKAYQRLTAPAFSWIPGVEKSIDALDLVGRAIENIPSHIFRNVDNLGKQLYKVVTLQATWKGVYDGLGRDTKGVRHMVHHAYWLYNNIVVKGDFTKLIAAVSKDSSTAVKGIKIYIDRKEIKEAIVIKHDELTTRRTLHRHFRHLVKSPMRILADDVVYNLRKDKAFVGFRQSFAESKSGKTLLLAASLYGTSFYKNTEAKVDERVKQFTAKLHHAFAGLKTDLKHQIKGLTPMQKAVYIVDYKNNDFPWNKVLNYELSTSEGQKLKLKAKVLSRLPGEAHHDLNELEQCVHLALTGFKNYISSRQSNMQKLAQAWALDGGLLAWAKGVDQEFVKSVKQGCRFIQSPQGTFFKAKALDAYFLYKELNPLKTDLQKARLTTNRAVVDTKAAYSRALGEYKSYKKERAHFQKQWNDWGKADGKEALTAYDITFRPQFVVDTSTIPPTVTCTTLSAKSAKRVNSNITSKKTGERFFMRLMWTQVLTQSDSLGTEFVRSETIMKTATKRADLIIRELKAIKPIQALSSKVSAYLASHILVKDMIVFEDGRKINAAKLKLQTVKLKLQTLASRIEQIHHLVPAARIHMTKAVRREKDFVQLMNVQVSDLNKTNFKIFEARKFNNIKLLEVQAALAYDFDDQVDGKKVEPSRYQDWKTQTAKHHAKLSTDYKNDKTLEEQGADLTIEEVLVSAEPPPSQPSHPLMQKWSSIYSLSAGKTRASSGSASGSSSSQVSGDSKLPSIWIRLPHQDNSDPSSNKRTANLMLIWRNYKMLKHLYGKHFSKAKVETKLADGEDAAIAKGEDSGLDFDSLMSSDTGSITRKANREAIRLDNDFDLLKDEVATDVDIAVNRLDSAIETAEQQVVSEIDQDLLAKEADLPHGQDLVKPESELSDVGDTIIETFSADVTSAVSTEVDAAQAVAETDVTAATDTADAIGMDAAEVMV
jgi:hypothetical protein